MKTFFLTLAMACALGACSTASAAVYVHAGPVYVSVARPVVRPVPSCCVAPQPVAAQPTVVAPAPVIVVARLTPYERYLLRQARLQAIQASIDAAVENATQQSAQ